MKEKLVEIYLNNSLVINISVISLLILFMIVCCVYKDELDNLYKKYKEIIDYVIVGVLTTIVSIASYWVLRFIIDGYMINTIISWICAVLFAYFANRKYVFRSKSDKILDEFSKFVGCRLLTLGMEIVLMYVFVSLFKINDMIAKIILQVIILILNYVFSKFFVFVKTKK